jgi:hypothetical protein
MGLPLRTTFITRFSSFGLRGIAFSPGDELR